MTEILRSGWGAQPPLWSLKLILDSAIPFASVAGSTSFVAESDFDFGLHNSACVSCRLHKNRGRV